MAVPGSPTITSVAASAGSATVEFAPPASDGGAAIDLYTVTSSPGSHTGTGASSPITVTGLTNGTAYTFTVTAHNTAGTGAPSGASTSATPYTGATRADPEVHAQPLDPNAAGATTPPTTTTPGSTKVDQFPQAPGTVEEGMPARPGAQTTQEEPGGHSTSYTPSTLEETGQAAPSQGGGTTAAAPGALPTGGDNIGVANTHQNPGGASRPASVTQDPETPVEPVASTNQAPYLTSSHGQEPAGV